MNIYQARFKNAVRISEKINKYIDQGYTVYDEDGDLVEDKFVITDKAVLLPISEQQYIVYFKLLNIPSPSKIYGAGMKIKEYNDKFKKWKIVDPKNDVQLPT